MNRSYGIIGQAENTDSIDNIIEEIRINGFSLVKSVLDKNLCNALIEKLETIYSLQKNSFGEKNLDKINELDLVRMPFVYDWEFGTLFTNSIVEKVVSRVLGKNYILHLQNAIINRPNIIHHQSSWHRDLPYQNFVISSPLAINAYFCLSSFNSITGGTVFIPFSHREETIPSDSFIENNYVQPVAEAGDVIFFDSMILHKAGDNTSENIRVGVNHVFTKPIIQQQINIPKMMEGKEINENMETLLGIKYETTDSVDSYRSKKLKRVKY